MVKKAYFTKGDNNMQYGNYQLPSEGFVRLNDILKIIPVSKSHWWDGVSKGKYPPPVKFSDRITCWRVEDIRELINKHAMAL